LLDDMSKKMTVDMLEVIDRSAQIWGMNPSVSREIFATASTVAVKTVLRGCVEASLAVDIPKSAIMLMYMQMMKEVKDADIEALRKLMPSSRPGIKN
jgi:hypothetical protein